jgi:hypothetical protein
MRAQMEKGARMTNAKQLRSKNDQSHERKESIGYSDGFGAAPPSLM